MITFNMMMFLRLKKTTSGYSLRLFFYYLCGGNARQNQVHQDERVWVEFLHPDSQHVENDPDSQDDAEENNKPPAFAKLRDFIGEFLPLRQGFEWWIQQVVDDEFLRIERVF